MEDAMRALIDGLGLSPHPEGGYYREVYRSPELLAREALPERFPGDRHLSTAIYYLLGRGDFSAFHRIRSDECWHFYAGRPLLLHQIDPSGAYGLVRLGGGVLHGEVFQAVVPAGRWFAAEPEPGGGFSLLGCTVSPGFDFADFELADADRLAALFPAHAPLIRRLCR
ncbi:MAG: cupin domain-containing protein [Acidobacteriota bacterium]|nr:cupin domain-containing protein [Acidobacteriota bacterium]